MSTEHSPFAALLDAAVAAAAGSWSPYSRFPVGAALLCADGTVVSGANVENRSYGLTLCAERSAICSAVGQLKRDIRAVAVYCGAVEYPVPPCGACRQVLSEFCGPMTPVVYAGTDRSRTVVTTLGELFPADSLHELRRG